ncbi:hypothetical protein K2X30_14915 [bacterium]|jgi:hypothetical protein|nr:hypothetical protein [bacterium]
MPPLSFTLPLIFGFLLAFSFGAVYRILSGMRMNLYLLSPEAKFADQGIIPISAENKKSSLKKIIEKKKWKEDLEITLMDYQGRSYRYHIQFHLWNRFHMRLVKADGPSQINHRKIVQGKRYSLSNGSTLKIGEREFKIAVTAEQLIKPLHTDLAEEAHRY